MKKVLIITGSLLTGLLFILSAWFKLFPVEPFEYKIVETTFLGWKSSVLAARLVIGVELGIGVLLLFSYRLIISLRIAMLALLVFSLHLLSVLWLQGNTDDCGCMGSLMTLTPLQGLLKNLGLLLLCFLMYRHAFDFHLSWPHTMPAVFMICTAAVFMLNPVDLAYSEKYLNKPYQGFALSLDTLYRTEYGLKVEKPVRDIRNEKCILAFLSASCPHCKIAARKAGVMHKENPDIPFYIFINGEDRKIKRFMKENGCADIPHSRLNGPLFIRTAGLNLPVIYYYNKGQVEMQVDYFTLEQTHVEQWLNR